MGKVSGKTNHQKPAGIGWSRRHVLAGCRPFFGVGARGRRPRESADPDGRGCEACGSMGKIVLFLVSFSSFYGGGGGGLMVAQRRPEIGSEWKREHDFQVWGRSGAFGGLVGLPGSPLGRFWLHFGTLSLFCTYCLFSETTTFLIIYCFISKPFVINHDIPAMVYKSSIP